jgi:putative hydrolase of HD superfamily
MRMFTENEFKSIVTVNGRIQKMRSDEISKRFNEDQYNPKDGEIVEGTDHLAAFMEVYLAMENGIHTPELEKARTTIKNRYEGKTVGGIRFGEIYADL